VATVFLLWPGLGVNWFGAGGNPNSSLAALSFSGQRLQYELAQFVPLAIIVLIGLVFYVLGGKARRQEVEEPLSAALAPGRTPHASASRRCCRASCAARTQPKDCAASSNGARRTSPATGRHRPLNDLIAIRRDAGRPSR
jgi:hypothetical protein